ncbi:hypothetical protein EJ06DRAFT_567236 [Trichodelitschia bisporula]|uniref:BTB domain-containing protein n=1 Tax=Trichodelitschia bisporula TaxID=703511 RepID=A0A6G1HMY8_9PEZI|nr:hypothetical protein EJ06DRAFT_567236 [Trichodelitschia bisporula]
MSTSQPLNELLTRDLVDIYVGSENTHWVLHEKLLCTKAPFFTSIFQPQPPITTPPTPPGKSPPLTTDPTHPLTKPNTLPPSPPASPKARSPSTAPAGPDQKKIHLIGLPDEDPAAFAAFVSWLYSAVLPPGSRENDLTPLYALALMGEKWSSPELTHAAVRALAAYYRSTSTHPCLRRVQYVCSEARPRSAVRRWTVGGAARGLVVGGDVQDGEGGLPGHWVRALGKDGGLAVEVLEAIRGWGVDGRAVPDYFGEGLGGVIHGGMEKGSGGAAGKVEVQKEFMDGRGEEMGLKDEEVTVIAEY